MQAQADAGSGPLPAPPALTSSLERALCCREGVEEGIALGVHFHTVVGGAGLADQATVLGQCLRIALGSELVQQLVEPSTSVKRKVTVPVGRSLRISGPPERICHRFLEGHRATLFSCVVERPRSRMTARLLLAGLDAHELVLHSSGGGLGAESV